MLGYVGVVGLAAFGLGSSVNPYKANRPNPAILQSQSLGLNPKPVPEKSNNKLHPKPKLYRAPNPESDTSGSSRELKHPNPQPLNAGSLF